MASSPSQAGAEPWNDDTIRPGSSHSNVPKISTSYNGINSGGGEGAGKAKSSSKACVLAEQKLSDFFPSRSASATAVGSKYNDADLQRIASLLQLSEREAWSLVPRIYTVLRHIGQLQLIGDFINEGCSDIWFPFTHGTLPSHLSPSTKANSSILNLLYSLRL
jgi:hypothetical protein